MGNWGKETGSITKGFKDTTLVGQGTFEEHNSDWWPKEIVKRGVIHQRKKLDNVKGIGMFTTRVHNRTHLTRQLQQLM